MIYSDRALAIEPSNPNVWLAKGSIYPVQNEHATALIYFDRALAMDESYAESWKARADALKKLGRKEEALIALGKARELGDKVHVIEGRYTMVDEIVDFNESEI